MKTVVRKKERDKDVRTVHIKPAIAAHCLSLDHRTDFDTVILGCLLPLISIRGQAICGVSYLVAGRAMLEASSFYK